MCPSASQSDLVLVLSNFSNPDYSSFTVTLSDKAASMIIGLFGSIHTVPITKTNYNVSLQQARDYMLYLPPNSWLLLIFTFFDGQIGKTLTVQLSVCKGAAHCENSSSSPSIGPSTKSNSARFSPNKSGYFKVEIINNEGLTGYYDFIYSIKEPNNFDSENNCTVNSTMSSCTMSALPGQNVLLGLPGNYDDTAQCHPIVDVSLTGQKTNYLLVVLVPVFVFLFCIGIEIVVNCVYVGYKTTPSSDDASFTEQANSGSTLLVSSNGEPALF